MATKRGTATHRVTTQHAAKSRHKAPQHKKRFLEKPTLIEESIQRAPHELEEEYFVPSPVHRGLYHIPLGMRFLIGYLVFLSVLYAVSFIFGISFPTTILFGTMIEGTRALIINIVLLVVILGIAYGFYTRKAFSFDLSIGFFTFAALNALISMMLFDSQEAPAFHKLLMLSFISLVVMNVVVVWYILHEKKYFFAERFKERPFHHRDKVFLYTIITFWIVTVLIGLTIGMQFYKDTTRLVDDTIKELRGDYYRGQLLCEEKTGNEHDVCMLVIATALSAENRPNSELIYLCNSIHSDFYKFTCVRSIAK